MQEHEDRIPSGDGSVTAIHIEPEGTTGTLQFIYAPGAGSNVNDGFGVYVCRALANRGIEAWRFQFPYQEAGRKSPDRPGVLEATWRAAIEAASAKSGRPVVAGGRSMGGRIASQVAADGADVRALALFAYPLIPPGRDASDRADHFGRIAVPVLLCSGTRDSFGTPAQIEAAAGLLPNGRVRFLEGADHGFATLKASGGTRDDVWQEASDALLDFLGGLEAGK